MGHEDHIEVPNDQKSLEEELKNERIRFGSFISGQFPNSKKKTIHKSSSQLYSSTNTLS